MQHHTLAPGDKPALGTLGPPRPAGRIPINDRVDPGPSALVSVNERGEPPLGKDRVFQLTPATLDAFRALRARAMATGFRESLFVLTSAYRGAAYQASLAAGAVTKYGKGQAATWVAQGRSEHITGRAIDLNLGIANTGENAIAGKFNSMAAYIWLKKNAGDFGFNPYSTEPWHWSYNVKR